MGHAFAFKVNWTCCTSYHMRPSVASTGWSCKEHSELLLKSLYLVSIHFIEPYRLLNLPLFIAGFT